MAIAAARAASLTEATRALVEREAMTPFGFELAEVVPLQSRWQVIQYSPRAIQANLVEDHRQILADCLAREYAGLERETQ